MFYYESLYNLEARNTCLITYNTLLPCRVVIKFSADCNFPKKLIVFSLVSLLNSCTLRTGGSMICELTDSSPTASFGMLVLKELKGKDLTLN